MIITLLLTLFFIVIKTILFIIPDFPDFPEIVLDSVDFVIDQINNVIGFLIFLFSSPLYTAIFACSLFLIFAEPIYHSSIWVLRKFGRA